MSSTRTVLRGIGDPDLRAMVARAIEQGWRATFTGSGHVAVLAPDGVGRVNLSSTYRGFGARGVENVRAQFKRAGLDLNPTRKGERTGPVLVPERTGVPMPPDPAPGPHVPEPQADDTPEPGPRLIDAIVGGMPTGWELPPWAVLPLTRPMPHPCRWCRTVVVMIASRRGNIAAIEPDGALHATECEGENAAIVERIEGRGKRRE